MKKIICALLTALLIFGVLSVSVTANESAVYISFNKGNNANDGFSANTPKKSLGNAGGSGAIGMLDGGGTLVVCEKLHIGANYTWKTRGHVTITANYDNVDYKNPEPATNPASGSMKFASGMTLTIESDITLDDLILFQEGAQNTLIVKDGATLTITENIVTMSKHAYYTKIIVEKGGKAIVNGGTFSAVYGDGDITIGGKANILNDGSDVPVKETVVTSEDNVCFLDYNGSNSNDGFSPSTAVKGYTGGVFDVLKNGGTVVVSGKSYVAGTEGVNEFTLPYFENPLVFTSVYDGVDYKNPEPATNPACAFKLGSGTKLNIEGNVVFDNIILFQENGQNTLVVKNGGSLTINENVVTMTKQSYYFRIVVEAGGTAVINGGTFSTVEGDGYITIGEKATILSGGSGTPTDGPEDGAAKVCFIDYAKGSDKNDGSSPSTAVKGYSNGVTKILKTGGTLVVSGKSYMSGTSNANAYSLPVLGGPLTITSVYDGVDYKNPEPANNPACAFKLGSGTVLNISSDVIFDNIILFQENNQNTIHVNPGATLIITDTVVFLTKPGNDYHFKIEVESGAVAILSEEAQKVLTIEGNGDIITYEPSAPIEPPVAEKTEVKLTVGSNTAYINGEAKTLDAAPINRNSRILLPVRFLADAFGANVAWDGATSTATLTNDEVTIVIVIGAPSMTVNGETVTLDSPAIIESSRTYLPVRAIANALGVANDNIIWDGATSTAILTK
ncbi:MAG: copper amine oxidase N-terminal domain-containing protein [Clostridia bacterium]|nr:copper amine oxidase N-terminal domain-containing protein [Clostridia bacterium]